MIQAHIFKLPTPRLLAYFKKHYRDRGGRMWYEYDTCGHISKEEYDAFRVDHNALKDELNKRENVEK